MSTNLSRGQRSSSHTGGTHKQRREAGNRGGRGSASSKRELTRDNFFEWGGKDFTPPSEYERDTHLINLQEIDENILLYVSEGVAEKQDGQYKIDARKLVDGYDEADAVKILRSGSIRHAITVIADEFSQSAAETVKANGGEVIETEDRDGFKGDEVVFTGLQEEVAAEESNLGDLTEGQEELLIDWGKIYIRFHNALDIALNQSHLRELNQKQRVLFSLIFATVFLPVIEQPVGYITVTGVIYAILTDLCRSID